MNKKLFYISPLVLSLVFSISIEVMADGDVVDAEDIILHKTLVPDGYIIVKGDDKRVLSDPPKLSVVYEAMQAKVVAGQLSDVKRMMNVAEIDDLQKNAEIWKSLAPKMREAEQVFNEYLDLKKVANGDMEKLQKAKMWLEKASAI